MSHSSQGKYLNKISTFTGFKILIKLIPTFPQHFSAWSIKFARTMGPLPQANLPTVAKIIQERLQRDIDMAIMVVMVATHVTLKL